MLTTQGAMFSVGSRCTRSFASAAFLVPALWMQLTIRAASGQTLSYFLSDLGSLRVAGSTNDGFVSGINDLGQVIGGVYSGDGYYFGFRTAGNQSINLATDDLGRTLGNSVIPSGINNSGQVTGSSFDPGAYINRPFRTEPNSAINPATDLVIFASSYSSAAGINSSGQVIGGAYLSNWGMIGFRTAPDSAYQAGDALSEGPVLTGANGINDFGQVVGSYVIPVGDGHHTRNEPSAPALMQPWTRTPMIWER